MRFSLPPAVLAALSRLTACNHKAYVVGGCVRDDALGIAPKEYDLCTSARPEQVHACFAQERVLDTGRQHGTVTLLMDGQSIEITTLRSDGHYTDGRHPDSVRFSDSLLEDLKRRDFTMNAMAWSPEEGLVDPFGGMEACRQKRITAVGDPATRFREDALRILRALRFAATLGFHIDADTYDGMLKELPGIQRISRERIAKELNLLLVGSHAAQTLRCYPRILVAALPPLQPMLHCPQRTINHVLDVWEHSLRVVAHSPAQLALRWAALLHDSGKPLSLTADADGRTRFRGHPTISADIARDCLTGLRQPRRLTDRVVLLVTHHDDRIRPATVARWLSRLGPEAFQELVLLQKADLLAHAPHMHDQAKQMDAVLEQARKLVADGACLQVRDLKLNGQDLLDMGYPEGPLVSQGLQALLNQVLDGRMPNEATALRTFAARWLTSQQSRMQ